MYVSKWDNYPDEVEFPCNLTGKKIYFFTAGYTNQMQCDVINAKIEIIYEDQTSDIITLIPPHNFRTIIRGEDREVDKWCYRNNKTLSVCLGNIKDPTVCGFEKTIECDGCFGQVMDFILKNKKVVKIKFKAVANEIVAGMLGITII